MPFFRIWYGSAPIRDRKPDERIYKVDAFAAADHARAKAQSLGVFGCFVIHTVDEPKIRTVSHAKPKPRHQGDIGAFDIQKAAKAARSRAKARALLLEKRK